MLSLLRNFLLNFLRITIQQTLQSLIASVAIDLRRRQPRPLYPRLPGPTLPGQGSVTRLGRLILTISGIWILNTSPVWAEQVGETDALETPSPVSTQVNSADIPSDQVNQFVAVYLQVVDLIDTRSGDLKQAATEAESLQLQQTIQAEAYELIEAAGLTQQTYWQLLGLANSDAEFRDRILARLEETDH